MLPDSIVTGWRAGEKLRRRACDFRNRRSSFPQRGLSKSGLSKSDLSKSGQTDVLAEDNNQSGA
jgi:hypothetical protein